MNLFAKTKPWMVASLCAATSLFAQDAAPAAPAKCRPQKSFEQGHELTQGQMMAAYNATARIDVRGSWDFYVTGSFLYWQPIQENMELGIATSSTTATSLVVGTTENPGNVINAKFSYKPGFKVGLGMNFDYDNWDAFAEYTWFHGTHTTSSNGPVSTGGVIYALQGHPRLPTVGLNGYTSASNSWQLKMDFADLNLGRAYYLGTKVSLRPAIGVRGAWIRQNSTYSYTNDGTLSQFITTGLPGSLASTATSMSWGVGPSIALDSNWMFGYGLRTFGKAEADLLYTRYNLSRLDTFSTLAGVLSNQVNVNQHHVDYLRPHMNLEMGLGWGSYFDNNNWHIDLAASYGFQVFWNQNMNRKFVDDIQVATSYVPNGDLYVQGLTATVRLDF